MFWKGVMITLVSEIGFNIRNLRQKRRMSQEQLAKRVNISKSMVSGYECGKYIQI